MSGKRASSNLTDAKALAYADLGAVYNLQGLKLEALEANYQAFRLSHDPQQRMRTLGDLAIGLREIGAFDAARLAFQIVVDSSASMHVRTNAILELMDLESAGGNRVAFERCRGSGRSVRQQDVAEHLGRLSLQAWNRAGSFRADGRGHTMR